MRRRWAVLTATTLFTFKSEHPDALTLDENGKTTLNITQDVEGDITERIQLNQYSILMDFAYLKALKAVHRSSKAAGFPCIVPPPQDVHFELSSSNKAYHVFVFIAYSEGDKNEWCCYLRSALSGGSGGVIGSGENATFFQVNVDVKISSQKQ